jgi:lysophospholipase
MKSILNLQQAPTKDIVIPPDQADYSQVQLVNLTATFFQQTSNQSLWARYPNPFRDYNAAMRGVDELLIADGSETGKTIPIWPLIVPQRKVDLVIVYEASSDAPYNWVNGTNLINAARSRIRAGSRFQRYRL